jgi:hypothetical protein
MAISGLAKRPNSMKNLTIFWEKWPNWMPFLPFLLLFWANESNYLSIAFVVLAFSLLLFLMEKMLAALHFGTRKWPRSLWILLAVGSSPQFLMAFLGLENSFLRSLTFACTVIYFLIKFLEDADAVLLLFASIILSSQIWLNLPIFGLEWMLIFVVARHLFHLKKNWKAACFLIFSLAILSIYLSKNTFEWSVDFSRFWLILFPFWPVFGLFMPIYLFFLKKTDRDSFPKKWVLLGVCTSVSLAFLFPNLEKMELSTAWLGLVLLAFPVFERGLLYGFFVIKKWKVWAIIMFFFFVQWIVFGWKI